MTDIVKFIDVESKIITFRNQKVLLDFDVAELYGVETKRVNEAVKNNPEKFPKGYIFELTNLEWRQIKINANFSNNSDSNKYSDVVENFDHLKSRKYSNILPKAFTEKGLYMLATILKSKKATETTIGIIETYAKIKELSRTVVEISEVPENKRKNH